MSEESAAKERKLEDIRKEAEQRVCALQKLLYFVEEFLADLMCGKCYPCSLGTAEAGLRLNKIKAHLENVGPADIQALKRIGLNMTEGSFCKKGKDVGKFLTDVLTDAEEEFEQHVSGACPKKECVSLVEYVIHPDLCSMCGECLKVCKFDAITGEKRVPYLSGYLPFEIRRKRCTKCGECISVCPTGAIERISATIEDLVNK